MTEEEMQAILKERAKTAKKTVTDSTIENKANLTKKVFTDDQGFVYPAGQTKRDYEEKYKKAMAKSTNGETVTDPKRGLIDTMADFIERHARTISKVVLIATIAGVVGIGAIKGYEDARISRETGFLELYVAENTKIVNKSGQIDFDMYGIISTAPVLDDYENKGAYIKALDGWLYGIQSGFQRKVGAEMAYAKMDEIIRKLGTLNEFKIFSYVDYQDFRTGESDRAKSYRAFKNLAEESLASSEIETSRKGRRN